MQAQIPFFYEYLKLAIFTAYTLSKIKTIKSLLESKENILINV